jgi:DNA anti-recombination protein RmuC
MGLFQNKKQLTPQQQAAEEVEHLFDDAFREELKERGRLYFERVINENAALFKQDLDATVAHINTELRQHVARQLDDQFAQINKVNTELREHIAKQFDDQFADYSKTVKEAQTLALDAVTRSSEALEQQHKQLSVSLEKSVANQDALIASAVEENKAHIDEMKSAQASAIESLQHSAQALDEQRQQLSALLEKGIVDQQALFVETFEKNMAQIIEHYLLEALGDQYDMKAQLPAIIKQMEENKQAIAEDMKL